MTVAKEPVVLSDSSGAVDCLTLRRRENASQPVIAIKTANSMAIRFAILLLTFVGLFFIARVSVEMRVTCHPEYHSPQFVPCHFKAAKPGASRPI